MQHSCLFPTVAYVNPMGMDIFQERTLFKEERLYLKCKYRFGHFVLCIEMSTNTDASTFIGLISEKYTQYLFALTETNRFHFEGLGEIPNTILHSKFHYC